MGSRCSLHRSLGRANNQAPPRAKSLAFVLKDSPLAMTVLARPGAPLIASSAQASASTAVPSRYRDNPVRRAVLHYMHNYEKLGRPSPSLFFTDHVMGIEPASVSMSFFPDYVIDLIVARLLLLAMERLFFLPGLRDRMVGAVAQHPWAAVEGVRRIGAWSEPGDRMRAVTAETMLGQMREKALPAEAVQAIFAVRGFDQGTYHASGGGGSGRGRRGIRTTTIRPARQDDRRACGGVPTSWASSIMPPIVLSRD